MNGYPETVVDRSVQVTGPDESVFDPPSPKGTRWHVMGKGGNDVADGMTGVWVYDYVDEHGSE